MTTKEMDVAIGVGGDDPRFGRHNDLPPNFRQIDEAEFWMQFSVYSFTKTQFKQCVIEPEQTCTYCGGLGWYNTEVRRKRVKTKCPACVNGKRSGPLENLHMFFYGPNEGVGYARTYEHNKPIGQGYGWCAPQFYFKFGICEHEWEGVPEKSRMCYHVSRCTKCGEERAIDSSD